MRQMIRAAVVAGCLALLTASVGKAAETSTATPGEQIKDGAIQVGQGIKRGAINLWEATKSVFSAGANKVSRPGEHNGNGAPPAKTPQPAPPSPLEK